MPRGRPAGTKASAGTDRDGSDAPDKPTNTLQTLDRGLQALTIVSQHEGGLSIADLAARLDVHRAIAYRLAATLELHGLVVRGTDGHLRLGSGVLALAAGFAPQLRPLALPFLRELARMTGATAFLSVPEGGDCVAILVCPPEDTILQVSYRIGSRHPLTRGAAGTAILSGRPPQPGEPEAVTHAREAGFSVSHGELQKGAIGVASPVRRQGEGKGEGGGGIEASVGVVALDDLDVDAAAARVLDCARALTRSLNL